MNAIISKVSDKKTNLVYHATLSVFNFINSSHFGSKVGMWDTIVEGDNQRTIATKFGPNLLTGFYFLLLLVDNRSLQKVIRKAHMAFQAR